MSLNSRDSSDDFFNSFDGNSPPAKPSTALRPPPPAAATATTVKKTTGAAPPPPPPPPAAAGATTTRRPRRPSPATTTTTTAAGGGGTAATTTATTSATTRRKAAAGTTTRPQRPISTTTASKPLPQPTTGTTTATSASYYGSAAGAQHPPSSSSPSMSTSVRPRKPNTTMPSYYGQASAGAPQQQPPPQSSNQYAATGPTVFNPASALQQQQQQQQPQDEVDDSGEWFQPDNPDTTISTASTTSTLTGSLSAPTSNNVAAVGASNPFAQSPIFQSSSSLEGTMTPAPPSMFVPTASSSGGSITNAGNSNTTSSGSLDLEDEPPLLEELGINIEHILLKVKAVVIPLKRFSGQHSALLEPAMIVEDADLAGPTAFALLLGGELLLTGKIHFGYIYGFGVFGCLSMTLVINLLSPSQAVSVWTVTSILGYSLIPVNVLAAVKIVLVNIAQLATLGQLLALITIVWSTVASTRLLEVGCGMRDQRYLLAYPIALLYSAFVLITIF